MAVAVNCKYPTALLAKIMVFLREGRSKTWGLDDTRKRITHTPDQWNEAAFFDPTADDQNQRLRFEFAMGTQGLNPFLKDAKTREEAYPYYHGRLISMLFDHFHEDFTGLAANTDIKSS
jgi:hypothetical protein